MIRKASFEGRFYPDTKKSVFQLITEIEKLEKYPVQADFSGRVTGAVLPHAGHIYSGYQTVPFFRYLREKENLPETFVIINPNHTGRGPGIALDPHEAWQNSIGTISLDKELSALLPYQYDPEAQRNEHSAEVIIPFIQYYFGNDTVQILPICMKEHSSAVARQLADDLHHAASETGRNILLIASSDFSHFLTPEQGYNQDQLVLDTIMKRDIDGLERTVNEHHISVCGYGPIMTLMAYTGLHDQQYSASVLARGHSGEVSPSREVVDYISILFHTSS
ncbi:MAG: AmmeMemoRadiSam system protein B [Bacteroidales bacterium]|nr:AmmeMemoRadiSam system protein B [Bacteroidales bacterium]